MPSAPQLDSPSPPHLSAPCLGPTVRQLWGALFSLLLSPSPLLALNFSFAQAKEGLPTLGGTVILARLSHLRFVSSRSEYKTFLLVRT